MAATVLVVWTPEADFDGTDAGSMRLSACGARGSRAGRRGRRSVHMAQDLVVAALSNVQRGQVHPAGAVGVVMLAGVGLNRVRGTLYVVTVFAQPRPQRILHYHVRQDDSNAT